MSKMSNPLVSVVIPTKNSTRYLELAFKSLLNQVYRNLEIIVVDNNSSDSTKKMARKYTHHVYNKGPERSSQMNYGVSKAKGEYILILASDCELEPNVIKECVKLGERGLDGVMIPLRHRGKGFWTEAKAFERECYDGDDDLESPWFIRRSVFKKVDGFDESLIAGEDWDIAYRLRQARFKLGRNKSVMHHHLGTYSIPDLLRKNFYYGKNIFHYLSKDNKNVSKQLPFLRKAYLRNWKRLVRHPVLTTGFMFLKVLESLAVAMGVVHVRFLRLIYRYV